MCLDCTAVLSWVERERASDSFGIFAHCISGSVFAGFFLKYVFFFFHVYLCVCVCVCFSVCDIVWPFCWRADGPHCGVTPTRSPPKSVALICAPTAQTQRRKAANRIYLARLIKIELASFFRVRVEGGEWDVPRNEVLSSFAWRACVCHRPWIR